MASDHFTKKKKNFGSMNTEAYDTLRYLIFKWLQP